MTATVFYTTVFLKKKNWATRMYIIYKMDKGKLEIRGMIWVKVTATDFDNHLKSNSPPHNLPQSFSVKPFGSQCHNFVNT